MQEEDWPLRGQEDYLLGATLVWRPFRAGEEYDHDHCDFCWAKFMDPRFSETDREFIESHPDVLTEGYTLTHEAEVAYGAPAWVCKACFDDFVATFHWIVGTD